MPLLLPASVKIRLRGTNSVMSDTAVLVIDMLNAYRHEDADIAGAERRRDHRSVGRAHLGGRERDDVDLIYVNDNYGDFTTDHDGPRAVGIRRRAPGARRADRAAARCELFLQKVRHSAFYSTLTCTICSASGKPRRVIVDRTGHRAMHPLLARWTPTSVISTVIVPPDAVAHIDPDLGRRRVADDGAQHASRNRARGEVPGLTAIAVSCWPAVCPQAPYRFGDFDCVAHRERSWTHTQEEFVNQLAVQRQSRPLLPELSELFSGFSGFPTFAGLAGLRSFFDATCCGWRTR